MADVRRPPDRTRNASGRSESNDRGQLLLVGALALAVVFVALALLLNTAIYTGNLATRDSGVEAAPTIEYVSESRQAGIDAIASVNRRNNTSATDLNSAFAATMEQWDGLASYHRAVAGDAADVDVGSTTNGTRIQQDDADRSFTNESGTADWTVASGVTGVRSMRFTVEESSLTGPEDPADFLAGEVFYVNVTSDAGTRRVFVYDTADGPEIRVDDDGSVTTCESGSDGTFVIDVPNESVGGASCPALGVLDDTDGSTDIDYRDGERAGGTYTMVVDEPPSALSLSDLNSPGTGSPYWTDAIYSAELNVTYRTGELDYEATIEVVPE